MKHPRTFAAVLLLATVTLPASAAELGAWLAKEAHVDSNGIVIPSSASEFDLSNKDATGITIGPGPTGSKDSKAIVFDGTQTGPLRTRGAFPAITSNLKVSFFMNPSDTYPEDDNAGCVFRYATQWELRYSGKGTSLSLIVWCQSGKFVIATCKAAPGMWQRVEASVREGNILLKVGDTEAEKPLDEPIVQIPNAAALGCGGGGVNTGTGTRAYRGALADIQISDE